MAYNEPLAARVRDHLVASRLPVEEKRMVGGLCFMVREKMCVGVTEDRLMVRLDPADVPGALERRGCTPMDFTGRPLKSFVFVSPEGWKRAEDFDYWLGLALSFNPRAQSSQKRPRAPRSARGVASSSREK